MADHLVLVAPVNLGQCSYLDQDLADIPTHATILASEQAILDALCNQPATQRLTSNQGHTAAVCHRHWLHILDCPDCLAWLDDVEPMEPSEP